MRSGQLKIDGDDRRVVWRPSPAMLWLRGAVFVVLGIGLPALTLGGEQSSLVTIPVLLVTAATAAWFVAGLRQGWELDDQGMESDVGRRRTTRLRWTQVRSLEIDEGSLVATTEDRGRVTVARGDTGTLRSALDAARNLGIVPAHVTLPGDEACGL